MISLDEICQLCPNNKFVLENLLLYLDTVSLIELIKTCSYFKKRKRLIYNIITPLVYDIIRFTYMDTFQQFHYKLSLKHFRSIKILTYLPFDNYTDYSTTMSNIINNNNFIRKRFKIEKEQKIIMNGKDYYYD